MNIKHGNRFNSSSGIPHLNKNIWKSILDKGNILKERNVVENVWE